eukprot:689011-Rhodomonas_salina.1
MLPGLLFALAFLVSISFPSGMLAEQFGHFQSPGRMLMLLLFRTGVDAQTAWANETCVIAEGQTSSSCGVASGLAAGAEVIIYLKLMRQGAVCTTCNTPSIEATLAGVTYTSLQCSGGLCFLIFENVQTAGDVSLAVALSGAAISGSPYTVTLDPGKKLRT